LPGPIYCNPFDAGIGWEAMEIFRDETGRTIAYYSLRLQEQERQVILDIHSAAARATG